MKQMICSICSYTYDEARGLPEAGGYREQHH